MKIMIAIHNAEWNKTATKKEKQNKIGLVFLSRIKSQRFFFIEFTNCPNSRKESNKCFR